MGRHGWIHLQGAIGIYGKECIHISVSRTFRTYVINFCEFLQLIDLMYLMYSKKLSLIVKKIIDVHNSLKYVQYNVIDNLFLTQQSDCDCMILSIFLLGIGNKTNGKSRIKETWHYFCIFFLLQPRI